MHLSPRTGWILDLGSRSGLFPDAFSLSENPPKTKRQTEHNNTSAPPNNSTTQLLKGECGCAATDEHPMQRRRGFGQREDVRVHSSTIHPSVHLSIHSLVHPLLGTWIHLVGWKKDDFLHRHRERWWEEKVEEESSFEKSPCLISFFFLFFSPFFPFPSHVIHHKIIPLSQGSFHPHIHSKTERRKEKRIYRPGKKEGKLSQFQANPLPLPPHSKRSSFSSFFGIMRHSWIAGILLLCFSFILLFQQPSGEWSKRSPIRCWL